MIASPILLLAPRALLWKAKWRGRHYPDVMDENLTTKHPASKEAYEGLISRTHPRNLNRRVHVIGERRPRFVVGDLSRVAITEIGCNQPRNLVFLRI